MKSWFFGLRALVVLLALTFGAPAWGANLSNSELGSLERGELVTRELSLDRSPRPRAGLSYALVDAPPATLGAKLSDGGNFVALLPYLIQSETLEEGDSTSTFRIEQGAMGFSGRYHLTVRWAAGRLGGKFALDPKLAHDLPELWGYFRLEPFAGGRTLVTFAIAFRLPLALRPFERRVLEAALTTPLRLRML